MQIKSADDVRRGIAGEGQLGSHMALVLGAEKNDSVLGFIASPKEVSISHHHWLHTTHKWNGRHAKALFNTVYTMYQTPFTTVF